MSSSDIFKAGIASTRDKATLTLNIKPKGPVIIGRKGATLSCSAGPGYKTSWLYNGVSAPPCGSIGCKLLDNGSLHISKVFTNSQKL